nr:LamG-like jellyroll fold domain-containing protein [uncultured Desulfobulbus sp.]
MSKTYIFWGFLFCFFVNISISCAGVNDGLVAYYKFEGNPNDSAKGNDGIANNYVGYTDGVFGYSASFDGVRSEISIPNLGVFSGDNNYSLSVWVFQESYNDDMKFFSARGENNVFWGANTWDGDNLLFFIWDEDKHYVSSGSLDLFKWHHIVTTFDTSSGMKIYVNGILQDSNLFNGQATSSSKRANQIGAYVDNHYWHGKIDELRIYNRALSELEIKQLATGSTQSYVPDAVTVSIFNTITGTPISGALVTVGDSARSTDTQGMATFAALSAGEYQLSIMAAGYSTYGADVIIQANGAMSLSYGLTPEADGDAPVITDVVSSYSSRSDEAFFLYGTSFPLSLTANIDWNGKTPGSVQFVTSKETHTQSITSDEDLTITLDMGKDFDPGGRLSVVAVAADGTTSAAFDANIEVMPQIFGTEILQMPVKQQNGSFSYNREVELGSTIFKSKVDTKHPVPDEIPFFGKKEPTFEPKISFDVCIEKNIATYTVKTDLENTDKKIVILGQEVEAGMAVGGQLIFMYSPDTDAWAFQDTGILLEPSLSADLIKTPPYYYLLPTPVGPIPIYFRAALGASIDGSVNIQGFNFSENDWALTGSIEPGLKGSVSMGTGVADALAVEGILAANATFGIGFKQFETDLDGLTVGMSGSIKVYALFFTHEWPLGNIWNYHWPESTTKSAAFKSVDLRSSDWIPMSRSYASGILTKDLEKESPSPYTTSEVVIPNQAGVFKYSYPTLADLGEEQLLVWITDDGTKTEYNRTSLLYSVYAEGNWAEPVKILENGTTDFYPQTGAVTSGAWLTWQDSATVFGEEDVELATMLASQEIAVAQYDAAGKTWSSQVNLSSNEYLDRSPALATSGNSALLCWVSNEENDLLGSAESPNTLMYAFQDGTSWSAPAQIATGLGAIVRMDLLYNEASATGDLVYSLDADGDIATVEDQELYAVHYSASGWGAPVPLTSNSLQDTNPQLAYDNNGNILLVWYQEGILMQAVDLDIANATTVVEGAASNGSADFTLTTGSGGQFNLLWPDSSEQGQDLFLALYDPTLGIWSKATQITQTDALERSVTAVVDSDSHIVLVYNRVNMTSETQLVDVDGNLVDVNMPIEDSTDLCASVVSIEGDLAVTADRISLTPSVPIPGNLVAFSLDIANVGLTVSENTTITLYYGDPAGDGEQIGESVVLSYPLVPGDAVTVSFDPWQVPDVPDVSREIVAVIDQAQSFADKDRTNNSLSTPIFYRDIALGQLYSQQQGPNSRRITLVVENNGALSCADIPVQITYKESILYETTIATLDPGKTVEISSVWDVSGLSADADGYLSIEGTVNSGQVISEVNYLNNKRPGRVLAQTVDGSVFVDTDQDLIDDTWELAHFIDLNIANATSDYDKDGYSDQQEYLNYIEGRLDADENIFDPTVINCASGFGYNPKTDARRQIIGSVMLLLN